MIELDIVLDKNLRKIQLFSQKLTKFRKTFQKMEKIGNLEKLRHMGTLNTQYPILA